MASYTGVTLAKLAQLVAATVDTVTFTTGLHDVEVLNRDGSAEIQFTVDGSTPTAGGDNTYVVYAGAGAALKVACPVATATVVKLVSAGIPKYAVTAVD